MNLVNGVIVSFPSIQDYSDPESFRVLIPKQKYKVVAEDEYYYYLQQNYEPQQLTMADPTPNSRSTKDE